MGTDKVIVFYMKSCILILIFFFQLLDLFSLDDPSKERNKQSSSSHSIKSVLETLPELWDTKIYDDEYDLNSFIQTLNEA